MDVVDLDETAVGRMILKPGWRWSTDVAPKMGTSTCQVRHLGAAVSGHLHVLVEDGSEMDIQAGDVYEIPPGHDGWVVGDVPWEAVEFASARVFGATEDETGVRSLGTILMTDIVGSTATLERVGDARWHSLLLAHNERLRAQIERFGGREIRTTGDGFQVLFTGAARGVRCAAAMIDALAGLDVQIRAGLHTGEVELAAGNLHGIAVHAAARVSALAGPSEVLVSAVTRDLLDGSGLTFGRRLEDDSSPVAGVAHAADEPRGLELVDDRRHGTRREVCRLGEMPGGHRSMCAEDVEAAPAGAIQSGQLRDPRIEDLLVALPAADLVGQIREQCLAVYS